MPATGDAVGVEATVVITYPADATAESLLPDFVPTAFKVRVVATATGVE